MDFKIILHSCCPCAGEVPFETFFVKKITQRPLLSPSPLHPPPPPPKKNNIKILCKTNSLTLANPPLPSTPQKICFQTWILLKKKNHLP